jgi:cell division protein FtsX
MGLINLKSPSGIAVGVIMLVVAIQIMVAVLPDLITAFGNISTISGLSFASFFASGGVVLLLLSVAILIGVFSMRGFGGNKLK